MELIEVVVDFWLLTITVTKKGVIVSIRWAAGNGSEIPSDAVGKIRLVKLRDGRGKKTLRKKLNIFKQLISQGREGERKLPNAEAHEACKEEAW